MIRKALLAAAIAFSAAAGIVAPASADPSPFGTLGCSCQPPATAPGGHAPDMNPTDQGIQNGLGFLNGNSPRPADN
ncbi:MAG TPA: hypothetical protein VMB04_16390 [Mycobacterium sp.]|nr:hypothetical protein [Mycobacterium sp.]